MRDAVDFYCSDQQTAASTGRGAGEMAGACIVDGVEHAPLPGTRRAAGAAGGRGGGGNNAGGARGARGAGGGGAIPREEDVVLCGKISSPHQTLSPLDGKGGAARAKGGGDDKGYSDPMNAYFECNICLELAQDPVVTQCGHLYCWPCIYKCVWGHAAFSRPLATPNKHPQKRKRG